MAMAQKQVNCSDNGKSQFIIGNEAALRKYNEVMVKYCDVLPVPLVEVATDLGLKIFFSSELKDNESGSIGLEDDGFIIYLNEKHSPNRNRFTLAHEIGHYVNDQDYFEKNSSIIDHVKLNRIEAIDPELATRERRANEFAANLLMPEGKFKSVCETYRNIEKVAKYFDVSISAASIRLDRLGDFNGYLI